MIGRHRGTRVVVRYLSIVAVRSIGARLCRTCGNTQVEAIDQHSRLGIKDTDHAAVAQRGAFDKSEREVGVGTDIDSTILWHHFHIRYWLLITSRHCHKKRQCQKGYLFAHIPIKK